MYYKKLVIKPKGSVLAHIIKSSFFGVWFVIIHKRSLIQIEWVAAQGNPAEKPSKFGLNTIRRQNKGPRPQKR